MHESKVSINSVTYDKLQNTKDKLDKSKLTQEQRMLQPNASSKTSLPIDSRKRLIDLETNFRAVMASY